MASFWSRGRPPSCSAIPSSPAPRISCGTYWDGRDDAACCIVVTGKRSRPPRPRALRQETSPPGPQRANQLELKTKLVSASLVTVAKRVPGQKEQEKNPEKSSSFDFSGFFSCSAVRFAHRAASEAGLARERWQALKPVGGKASSIYGENAGFLLLF